MTPVKSCFLLLFCVLFIASTVSEVVQSMTQCGQFLLHDKAPKVPGILENGQIMSKNRYKVICQTYKNVRRFVTLYDTKNRIPVFSAYKFTGAKGKRPKTPWKMEPQLENMNRYKSMEDSDDNTMYNNQAGNIDYINCGYDRGHLLPSLYVNTQEDKASTFTLTNVVPQVRSFNHGSWRRMEQSVTSIMNRNCIENNNVTAYVMIGAQPSVKNKIKNRVNVPSLLWSAFCCYSEKQEKWIAGAYWGDNVEDKKNNTTLYNRTLRALHDKLSTGARDFEAFPKSNCSLESHFFQ